MELPHFEVHITFNSTPEGIEEFVKSIGWKFSKIDGDPKLGEGVKSYATLHTTLEFGFAKTKILLHSAVETFLMQEYVPIRMKIETVVYDKLIVDGIVQE